MSNISFQSMVRRLSVYLKDMPFITVRYDDLSSAFPNQRLKITYKAKVVNSTHFNAKDVRFRYVIK